MIFTGTAISAVFDGKLTREWTPSAGMQKRLESLNIEPDDICLCTILIGVHSTEKDGIRARVENPNAIDPKNKNTYFVEVVLPLTDIAANDRGQIAMANAILEDQAGPIEIFFKPSRVTSRLVYLAEGIKPKLRADGQPVQLMRGQGEILHQFESGYFSDTFISAAETGLLSQLRENLTSTPVGA